MTWNPLKCLFIVTRVLSLLFTTVGCVNKNQEAWHNNLHEAKKYTQTFDLLNSVGIPDGKLSVVNLIARDSRLEWYLSEQVLQLYTENTDISQYWMKNRNKGHLWVYDESQHFLLPIRDRHRAYIFHVIKDDIIAASTAYLAWIPLKSEVWDGIREE